ncbi:hypothetical protein JXB22_10840 [candidate division WOR-3 bacterium]|nr:hypothetical protein [candidate division WOR-3 bacterium]
MQMIQWLRRLLTKALRGALEVSLFAGVVVIQSGDTLYFSKNEHTIETWALAPDSTVTPQGLVVHTQKVKVSDNNKHFILYDEYRNSTADSLMTTLSLYTSGKERLWLREYANGRRIDFDKTEILNDDVAVVSTDKTYGQPVLELIHNNTSITLMEKDQWQRLVTFAFAPDMRYLALHVRNPHNRKMWDFIHFIDRKTKDTWTYLFPICISCKRHRIDLQVDNEGNTEVIYKDQHRIFNRKGSLVDFFMGM